MATPNDPPPPQDPESQEAYRRLADLAEGLVDQIASLQPDWCAVGQAATELAVAAQLRCKS